MAKGKKAKSGAAKSPRRKNLTKTALVAKATATSFAMRVGIDFLNGLGQATAVLFRNGVLINMQSISMGGSILFSDVQSHDTLAVNGVCSGDAIIDINVPTNPATPQNFNKIILGGYSIL